VNSFEALVLFIGAVIAVGVAVYVLQSQVSSAASVAGASVSATARTVSHAFRITSVYGNASETNVVVRAVSGQFDLNSAVVYVNGVPHQPDAVTVLGSSGDFLSAGSTGIITVATPFSDQNCYVVDMGGVREIWGVCT